jgi:acyl-CoA hydrolase
MGNHVFVSYSRQDQTYARKLADDLRRRSVDVWIDDRIDYGDRWWRTIVQAIRASAAFVVVMTPDSEESEWVEREVMLAMDEEKPIFPLLLHGKGFPIFINKQYANVTDGQMPPQDFYDRLRQVLPTPDVPEAAPPKPKKKRLDTQALEEKPIGRVIRYFDQLGVVGIELTDPLRVGDVIRIRGRTTDFIQQAESIEIDRQRVNQAPASAQIGLLVNQPARVGDKVYKVTDERRKRVLLTERDKNEKPIGRVIHYFDRLGVAGIELTDPLRVGDVIHIRGRTTDFVQSAESIELDRQRVNQAPAGAQIGLLVDQRTRVGDEVYRVIDKSR